MKQFKTTVRYVKREKEDARLESLYKQLKRLFNVYEGAIPLDAWNDELDGHFDILLDRYIDDMVKIDSGDGGWQRVGMKYYRHDCVEGKYMHEILDDAQDGCDSNGTTHSN